VRGNETAFTAFKAIMLALAIAIGINLVGAVISAIPIVLAYAAALWSAAIAALIAEGPVILLVAAIALLVFGIMELVQHWTQVKAFFANIAAAVGGFFSWLGGHVHDALGKVGQFFQAGFDKLGQIVHWFTTLTPQKIAYMVGYALGFLLGLPVRGAIIVWQFVQRAAGFIAWLWHEAPGFIARMAVAIVTWLLHMKDEAIKHIIAFAVAAVAELVKLWHEAPGFILKMAIGIVAWLIKLKDDAWQKIKDVTAAIWSELQKLPGQALQAAKDFIAGIVNGIKNGAGAVVNAIKNMAGGMVDGFKNALGIHSPSTVMFQHGVNLVQGLINGFRSINLASAWMQHTAALASPITAGGFAGAGHGVGGSVPGGAIGGLRLANGGGGNTTHNWTLNFPNARDHNEIKKAILDSQQEVYRRSRRPGGYGGFGSDYTSDS